MKGLLVRQHSMLVTLYNRCSAKNSGGNHEITIQPHILDELKAIIEEYNLGGEELSDKLETLILMATKQAGSYDPNEALTYVEEQMTMQELKQAEKFLTWVHKNKKTFGHGNIKAVWAASQK